MTSEEAKELLQAYRSGGADDFHPRFAEALKQMSLDPALARWFNEQRQFDNAFASGLQSIPPPAHLKSRLLSMRPVVRPSLWQQYRLRVALAACFVGFIATGGLLTNAPLDGFPEFRQKAIREVFEGRDHLDFESANLVKIQQWLAAQEIVVNLRLPPALSDARVVGCRLIETSKRPVPMLCLRDGPRHLHLLCADGTGFVGLPAPGTPEFEKCGIWKTASWQDGGTAYVLIGMKNQTFVSRFRKSGRWITSG